MRKLDIVTISLTAIVITFLVVYMAKTGDEFIKVEQEIEEIEQEIVETQLPKSEGDMMRDMIREYCSAYGVENVELAIAVSRLETGNWKSEAFTLYNNVGGISRKEQPLKYENLCKGMEAYMETLKWYQDNGWMEDITEMAKHYCPVNKANWSKSVSQILEEERSY